MSKKPWTILMSRMMSYVALLCCASVPPLETAAAAETYTLKPTPKTITWGYYDGSAPPVLRIRSGDTVHFETLITLNPKWQEEYGVPASQVPQSLRDIYLEVTNKGPGGHILTGPVYIEGAESGDTLEVRIQGIDLALPYCYNSFSPGRGFLPEDFPYARTRIIPLDRERMVAVFGSGVAVPLRPFFGSMGVAPPVMSGRISSAPPWVHGGNMDNKELVAGTILWLPVHVAGALFSVGDGHAGQGNGEVDLSALETSLAGTLQFVVRKDLKLLYPRAETPTHYVSMGFHEDLTEAAKMAVRNMIDFLVHEKHLSREDAYMLTSVAGDVEITQLVDGNKGVHVLMPKTIFSDGAGRGTPKAGFGGRSPL
jgi:acetamidase/formamidase